MGKIMFNDIEYAGGGGGGASSEAIAPIEETSTATQSHPAGSLLFFDNVLYKAKTALAIGDTIITEGANTNVEATDVDTELKTKANLSHTHTKSQITDLGTIPANLSDLEDVSLYEPSEGDILCYEPIYGKWQNAPINFPSGYDLNPAMDGIASPGSFLDYAKGDHVHPTDTSRASASDLTNHINNTNNPHSVTASQVGLGSVINTGDSNTPVSGGTTKFTTGGAYTELNKKTDKVSNPTNGNFAGLDSNGNLTDSGKKASDFKLASEHDDWSEISNKPNFATVATSGSYNDLSNKPTIPTVPSISLNNQGTASSTSYAYQRLSVGNSNYTVSGSVYMEQSVSLSTSGVTAVTFSNSIITANSLVDVYCSDSGLDYESISVVAGSCVVTLPKVDSAKNVAVRIYIR